MKSWTLHLLSGEWRLMLIPGVPPRRSLGSSQPRGQPLVQPLKLHILQVKVLLQELPIYLGSDIRLRRR